MRRRTITPGWATIIFITVAACRSERADVTAPIRATPASAPAATAGGSPPPLWKGPALPGNPIVLGSGAFRVGDRVIDLRLTADAIYALTDSGLHWIDRGTGASRRVAAADFDPVHLVDLPDGGVAAVQRNVRAIVPVTGGVVGTPVAVQGRVHAVLSTRDSQILGYDQRGVVIVDAATGQVTRTSVPIRDWVGALVGTDRVATVAKVEIEIAALATGAVERRLPTNRMSSLWPSPDGHQMISAADGVDGGQEVVLWNLRTGDRVALPALGHSPGDVAWLADSSGFVALARDQLVRADRDGKVIATVPTATVSSGEIGLGADGAVVVGDNGGLVQVVDAGDRARDIGAGHVGPVQGLRFVAGGLASAGPEALLTWDLATSRPVRSSSLVPIDPATGVADPPRKVERGDGEGPGMVIGNIVLYRTDQGVMRADSRAELPTRACSAVPHLAGEDVAADPGGTFVAAYADGVLQLWRRDGVRVAAIALATPVPGIDVEGGAVSADGKVVLFPMTRGLLRWDVGVGVTELALPAVSAVAFDVATPRVAVGFATGQIAIWDGAALPAGAPVAAKSFTTPCPVAR